MWDQDDMPPRLTDHQLASIKSLIAFHDGTYNVHRRDKTTVSLDEAVRALKKLLEDDCLAASKSDIVKQIAEKQGLEVQHAKFDPSPVDLLGSPT